MMYTRLQYISQGKTVQEQTENIQSALDAGCRWIQLRFKNAVDNELFDLAVQVKQMCSNYQATFIMNDRVDIAKNADADGVHLGLLDISIAEARSILGENKIIGGTANTISDVMMRISERCDYIGLGPFRFTPTKEKLSPILGLDGIAQIMKEVISGEIQIPIYAVGGIIHDDLAAIRGTGVFGVAVSRVITTHPDKKHLLKNLHLLLNETSHA